MGGLREVVTMGHTLKPGRHNEVNAGTDRGFVLEEQRGSEFLPENREQFPAGVAAGLHLCHLQTVQPSKSGSASWFPPP